MILGLKKLCAPIKIEKPLAQKAFKSLTSFKCQTKLQGAAWLVLATYLTTCEDRKEITKLFQVLDENGHGLLNKEELTAGYKKYVGEEDAEKKVDGILKTLDLNGIGSIDYTQFVVGTFNRQDLLAQEKLEAVFRLFDLNGNGKIEPAELRDIFNPTKNADISNDVWTQLIKEIDGKGDDISLEVFKKMMKAK